MKLISKLLLVSLLILNLQAKDDEININFKNLEIMDLVKITSKILDKNIMISEQIRGKVDFVSNKPLKKSELIMVLGYALEDKGYTLVQNRDIIRIIKLSESANSNLPVVNSSKKTDDLYMITEIFNVQNADVDYVASKIRHLITKNGKLVTNKESNMMIITDFKENIQTVKKVVKIMTNGFQKESDVVELKNIDATDAKKSLDLIAKSKFNEKIETDKVSIVDIKENNSLLIIGSKSNIEYLSSYIRRIDMQDSLTKREVKVLPLKNVEAVNVVKIIEGITSKKKYIDPNDKPLASVDEESNSIVLMGPVNELEYVQSIITELDKQKAQVYVQARIIEVNDKMVDEIGISYGIFGGTAGNKGLAAFSTSLNGGSSSYTNFIGTDSVINLNIPDITSGLALGASLNLLQQNGALDIVSQPSILAVNNKESSIYVGETISVKTSSSVTDGGLSNENYKREDVGLKLSVKPRISNDSKVTLEINTVLEGVLTTDTASDNADTSKKEVKTTAILNNGESVIIGGLIESKEEETIQKVPLLGDIPLFGELFRNRVTEIKKNNLVVIITPYLIPQTKDITFVRNQLSELKNLEDRFLEKSLIRLKKEALKRKLESQKYEDELQELKDLEEKIEDKENRAHHEEMLRETLWGNENDF